MNPNKPTLAIYGIKDNQSHMYPFNAHDHSLVLFLEGKIIKFLQLERFSGIKNDNKMHQHLYSLLKKEKMAEPDHYDIIFVDNILGRAFISDNGKMRFEGPLNNKLATTPEAGNCNWLGKSKKAYVLNHELSHLYSCVPFWGNFNNNSLLIHFDGGASLSNFSAWHFSNEEIKPIEYHWKYKYLSSLFNANALTFSILNANMRELNSVPGKLMGLAAFGSYDEKIEQWLKKNHYFHDCWGNKTIFFNQAYQDWGYKDKGFNQKNPFIQDILATIQHIFVRDTLNAIKQLHSKTNSLYLYFSGGAALNIVLNNALIKENLFKDIFIPPCPNDSGLAIGAGACLEMMKHHSIKHHSPYLNNIGIEKYAVQYSEKEIDKIANFLLEKKVIGIINGYGETGPRALGNRSIIALANDKELARKVSMKHKNREWYRPVAPVMLEKNARFLTGIDNIHPTSRYMLLEFDILKDKQKNIEGVVHVNGTSRIQTIFSRDENPFMFDLLEKMDNDYGIKALINTSFNIRGKPMAHTISQATLQAKKMNLDGLVINGLLKRL